MPKDPSIKKVLVIGSGPIIIGQAAEFDYSGTQACRALKSEGVETVLVNSNPATIMTDPDIADHVYIEPLTAEVGQDGIGLFFFDDALDHLRRQRLDVDVVSDVGVGHNGGGVGVDKNRFHTLGFQGAAGLRAGVVELG